MTEGSISELKDWLVLIIQSQNREEIAFEKINRNTEAVGQWQHHHQQPNINIISGPEKKCVAEIYLKKKMV